MSTSTSPELPRTRAGSLPRSRPCGSSSSSPIHSRLKSRSTAARCRNRQSRRGRRRTATRRGRCRARASWTRRSRHCGRRHRSHPRHRSHRRRRRPPPTCLCPLLTHLPASVRPRLRLPPLIGQKKTRPPRRRPMATHSDRGWSSGRAGARRWAARGNGRSRRRHRPRPSRVRPRRPRQLRLGIWLGRSVSSGRT